LQPAKTEQEENEEHKADFMKTTQQALAEANKEKNKEEL